MEKLVSLGELLNMKMEPGERYELSENTYVIGNKQGNPVIVGWDVETYHWWRNDSILDRKLKESRGSQDRQ